MPNKPNHDKPTDDRYIAALEGLHQAFILAMGKAIYAPLDLSESGLKILDSGCNNGRWLFDLQNSVSPARHTYIGTDLLDVFFPTPPPPNFTFHTQDINASWPPSWNGTFDLVQQRTVLVNARKNPIADVISELVKVLKPGGWVQLMEGDFAPIPENGPALREFLDLGAWFFDVAGPGREMGPELKSTLQSLGLKGAEDRAVDVGVGAKLEGQGVEVVEGSIEGLCAAIPGSLEIIRGMEHPFSLNSLETLEERLRKELSASGGYIRYRVAWAQK